MWKITICFYHLTSIAPSNKIRLRRYIQCTPIFNKLFYFVLNTALNYIKKRKTESSFCFIYLFIYLIIIVSVKRIFNAPPVLTPDSLPRIFFNFFFQFQKNGKISRTFNRKITNFEIFSLHFNFLG